MAHRRQTQRLLALLNYHLSVGDDGGDCRHSHRRDDAAICQGRIALPALSPSARGAVRRLLRHHAEFPQRIFYQNTGFSLLFAIFLLIVSVRQSLLDIYPRPGHEYIGSAVFGLHMPVWSIIIALCLLIAFAAKLAVARRR